MSEVATTSYEQFRTTSAIEIAGLSVPVYSKGILAVTMKHPSIPKSLQAQVTMHGECIPNLLTVETGTHRPFCEETRLFWEKAALEPCFRNRFTRTVQAPLFSIDLGDQEDLPPTVYPSHFKMITSDAWVYWKGFVRGSGELTAMQIVQNNAECFPQFAIQLLSPPVIGVVIPDKNDGRIIPVFEQSHFSIPLSLIKFFIVGRVLSASSDLAYTIYSS